MFLSLKIFQTDTLVVADGVCIEALDIIAVNRLQHLNLVAQIRVFACLRHLSEFNNNEGTQGDLRYENVNWRHKINEAAGSSRT